MNNRNRINEIFRRYSYIHRLCIVTGFDKSLFLIQLIFRNTVLYRMCVCTLYACAVVQISEMCGSSLHWYTTLAMRMVHSNLCDFKLKKGSIEDFREWFDFYCLANIWESNEENVWRKKALFITLLGRWNILY